MIRSRYKKKSVEMIVSQRFLFLCDRDRIQTCNRLIRSQLLYSVELRGQSLYFCLNFNSDSDRDRIQTCNRLIRSQLLYSVELRGQSLYFCLNFNSNGDRDRIQTCNRLIRSQLLYSVELRGHCFVIASAKVVFSFKLARL